VDSFDTVLVDARGHLVLSPDGQPQVSGKDGQAISRLRPICEDWQSPNVFDPNRLRVLFSIKKK